MPRLPRTAALAFLLAGTLGTGGCTLVKPMVGAVTGPIYVLAHTSGNFGCGCDDGRAVAAFLCVSSVIGAVAGLVTGVVSDIQVLCGNASYPAQNWWDPFATNTDPCHGP
ncbi:MAG: hypothetical protein U1E73_06665 [Planctomycetota bacterium]